MRMVKRVSALAAALCLFLSWSALSDPAGEVRKLPIDLSGGAPYDNSGFTMDVMVYEDPSIRVERARTMNEEMKIDYYSADVVIQDASQLRTAPADPNTFISERRVYGTTMAGRVNAVVAVNGDYCGDFHGHEANKYVLRQGTVYRDTVDTSLDMLLIDEDGDFHILPAGPELADADKTQVNGRQVINALQFGPGLIIDGVPAPDEILLDRGHSPQFAEPDGTTERLCLAQLGPLHYLIIATRNYVNIAQMRDLVLSIAPDCQNAYILDGGGSLQFIFMGKKINRAGSDQNIRKLSDIVYFASAWFPAE